MKRVTIEVNDLYIGGDKNMAGLDLMMYKDGVKDGRAEGREEGIQEGIQQGMQKGIQQGMQQGIQQGSIKAILNMFKKGLIKIKDAASELGVSEKEFMKLAKA